MAKPCMWETAHCFRASAPRLAAISPRCSAPAQMRPMPRISTLTWGLTAKAETTAFANRGRRSLKLPALNKESVKAGEQRDAENGRHPIDHDLNGNSE